MFMAIVKGTVTSTAKHRSLKGVRLVIVQPVDPRTDQTTGAPQIAADTLGTAVGACAMVTGDGRAVQDILRVEKDCPARLLIVAQVDTVESAGSIRRY